MVKLWIDDLRPPPRGWEWAKTSKRAILKLTSHDVDEVSFDHDLGGDDTTRAVVTWMSEEPSRFPAVCRVHTANPVGRTWLEGTITRYGPGVTAGPAQEILTDADRIHDLEKEVRKLSSDLADLTWRFNEWTDTTP